MLNNAKIKQVYNYLQFIDIYHSCQKGNKWTQVAVTKMFA